MMSTPSLPTAPGRPLKRTLRGAAVLLSALMVVPSHSYADDPPTPADAAHAAAHPVAGESASDHHGLPLVSASPAPRCVDLQRDERAALARGLMQSERALAARPLTPALVGTAFTLPPLAVLVALGGTSSDQQRARFFGLAAIPAAGLIAGSVVLSMRVRQRSPFAYEHVRLLQERARLDAELRGLADACESSTQQAALRAELTRVGEALTRVRAAVAEVPVRGPVLVVALGGASTLALGVTALLAWWFDKADADTGEDWGRTTRVRVYALASTALLALGATLGGAVLLRPRRQARQQISREHLPLYEESRRIKALLLPTAGRTSAGVSLVGRF